MWQLALERERDVQQVLDAIPDGVLIVEAGGRIRFANATAEALFGYSRGSLPGENIEVLVPEGLRARHRQHRDEYARAPVTRPMGSGLDLHARRQDGSEFPVDVSLSAVESGRHPMVVAIVRDVTERAAVLAELQRSRRQYQMIVESASEIFYRVSIEDDPMRGRVEFVSPQCRTVTGYGPEEFVNDPALWAASIHPEDRLSVMETTRAVLASRTSQARYYRLRDREGRYHRMADRIVPIVDSHGHVTGYQGVARDVTERAQADEQRQRLETKLAQSQKVEAIGRLAGGVAHDFNNLLTVILGVTGDLLDRPEGALPAGVRGDVEMIRDAGERGAALTQQLLAFARQQVVQPAVLEVNAIVADLAPMLRRLIKEDIEFRCELGSDAGRVRIDANQVEQVLVNLVVNARDAMPAGGTLTIQTSDVELEAQYRGGQVTVMPGRYVLLAVSDTGVGMSRDVQARVFEPFFTTKEAGQGTGLGLATVYGIVKQNGGYIWVDSEPGDGTMFTIHLPLVEAPVAETGPIDAAQEMREGTETVLLVEDEDVVRAIARRVLTSRGYAVIEARHGHDALRVASEHAGPIHLLLTDVVMPGMSGHALARQLIDRCRGLKVLYMSGYTADAIIDHGELKPGLRLLQKPFTPRDLAQAVRGTLDAPDAGRGQ